MLELAGMLEGNDHEGIADVERKAEAVVGIDVQHELKPIGQALLSPVPDDLVADAGILLADEANGRLPFRLGVEGARAVVHLGVVAWVS